MGRRLAATGLLGVLVLSPAVWAKDKNKGLKISGYLGRGQTTPASGEVVKLFDTNTGKLVGASESGVFGRYKFEKLEPGLYVIQIGDIKREVPLKDKDKRVDFDLTAKDGRQASAMEKLATGMAEMGASGGSSGDSSGTGGDPGVPAPAPSDPQLMQSFAGSYYGYNGYTEIQLELCPGGSFIENSESSYSGSSSDSLGNSTGSWGSASQRGGAGSWSIQGSRQGGTLTLAYRGGKRNNVTYRAIDNGGCYKFGGSTVCRKSAARCQ